MTGDHIRALVNGEWRHAIDCGDGTVLHLAADPSEAPAVRVRRSYRPEFVSGAERVEVVVHRERVFPARQVVARAYSRASDPALARMFESSSGFASWCKAGHVEERENVAVPIPALVQPSAPSAPAPRRAAPQGGSPRKAAGGRNPAAKKAAGKKPAAKAKKAAAKKAAPGRKVAAKKPGARKPAARAAKRPAPKAPAKSRGRAAARRKGGKARGARR